MLQNQSGRLTGNATCVVLFQHERGGLMLLGIKNQKKKRWGRVGHPKRAWTMAELPYVVRITMVPAMPFWHTFCLLYKEIRQKVCQNGSLGTMVILTKPTRGPNTPTPFLFLVLDFPNKKGAPLTMPR